MPGPDPFEIAARLPLLAQLVLYAVIGLGVLGMVAKTYFKPGKPSPESARQQAQDMMLVAGEIADMKPVRQIADAMDRIAVSLAEIERLLREQHTEDEIDRRAEEKARHMLEAERRRL